MATGPLGPRPTLKEMDLITLLQKCKKNGDKQKGKESKAAFFQNTQPNTDENEGEQANAGSYAQAGEWKAAAKGEQKNSNTARKQEAACMSGTCAVR